MRRKLVNLAVAVSLVLAVATVALWVRSLGGHDFFDAKLGRLNFSANNHLGTIAVIASTDPADLLIRRPAGTRLISYGTPKWSLNAKAMAGGFDFEFYLGGLSLAVPHWFCLMLLMTLPAAAYGTRRRARRRRAARHCPTCGYDCRATPDRCPECGTPVPTPSTLPIGGA